jgi:hypothetical protein
MRSQPSQLVSPPSGRRRRRRASSASASAPWWSPRAKRNRGPTVAGDTKSDLKLSQDPPAAHGGLTAAGDTKSDLKVSQSYADKVGSLSPNKLAAAYGTTKIDAKPVATPHAAVVSTDDGTNGWRIAAVAEAGLLAAIALGTATLVGRTRPRRGAAA